MYTLSSLLKHFIKCKENKTRKLKVIIAFALHPQINTNRTSPNAEFLCTLCILNKTLTNRINNIQGQ